MKRQTRVIRRVEDEAFYRIQKNARRILGWETGRFAENTNHVRAQKSNQRVPEVTNASS